MLISKPPGDLVPFSMRTQQAALGARFDEPERMLFGDRGLALDRGERHLGGGILEAGEVGFAEFVVPSLLAPPQRNALGHLGAVDVQIGFDEDKLLGLTVFGADDAGGGLAQFQAAVFVRDAGFAIDGGGQRWPLKEEISGGDGRVSPNPP